MRLTDELFCAITGAAAAARSGKRDERRVNYASTVFVLPIVANKTRPAVMVEVSSVSRKGIGFEADFPVRTGDKFAIRLMTRAGDPVLVEYAVKRTYPVRTGWTSVGADFVRVLKDTRGKAA